MFIPMFILLKFSEVPSPPPLFKILRTLLCLALVHFLKHLISVLPVKQYRAERKS